MYVSKFIRLDISANVAILSRKLQESRQVDWVEARPAQTSVFWASDRGPALKGAPHFQIFRKI